VGVFALASATIWRARSRPVRFAYPALPLLLAVVWGLFQLAAGRTAYAFETQRAAVHWTTFLAVFLIGLGSFGEDRIRRWFRSAMLWFGFAVAALATIQTFTSEGRVFWLFPTEFTDFVMGPILYRNHYAAFIEVVFPIALYEALRKERTSFLYSVMAAVMYASVIASASRAGTVLTTAEILAVVALTWARGRTTGRAIGGALLQFVVLLAVFSAVVGYQAVWNRFWAADPMSVRRELAVSSLHMIQSHAWFGVGLGAWSTVYPRYAIIDIGAFANQAHNDWLQWAAEGGIPFGIGMATLFFWCLRPAFQSIWGLGIIAVFLHALVDYPFSRPALGSWAIVLVAMLAAWQLRSKARGDRRPPGPHDLPPGAVTAAIDCCAEHPSEV
jgi:O-antigen ligase